MSAKMTNEMFIAKMKKMNPYITPNEEYKGRKEKIDFICKNCGEHILLNPDKAYAYKHAKCKENKNRLNTERFIEKYSKLNKPVDIIGEYINCKTKIKCKCLICNKEFYTTPDSLIKGSIHSPCGKEIGHKNKRSNTEEFIEKLAKINKYIEVLGEYQTAMTEIQVRCRIDGNVWYAKPNSLLNGVLCPKCSTRITYTKESFLEKLNDINKDVEIVGEYINTITYTDFKCKICGNIWTTKPNWIIASSQSSCPKCGIEKSRQSKILDQSCFENMLKIKNPEISVIGKYIGRDEKIKVKCNICGNEWSNVAEYLLNGSSCPICNKDIINSKLQNKVNDYLQELGYEVNHERNCNLKPINPNTGYILPYDNEIIDLKLIIEVNGQQHYDVTGFHKMYAKKYNTSPEEAFNYQKFKDNYKKQFALDNGYYYLEIPYFSDDFKYSWKVLIDDEIQKIESALKVS